MRLCGDRHIVEKDGELGAGDAGNSLLPGERTRFLRPLAQACIGLASTACIGRFVEQFAEEHVEVARRRDRVCESLGSLPQLLERGRAKLLAESVECDMKAAEAYPHLVQRFDFARLKYGWRVSSHLREALENCDAEGLLHGHLAREPDR